MVETLFRQHGEYMRRKRFNLTEQEKSQLRQKKLDMLMEKETVWLNEPFHGYCDNADHPLFTIKVTLDKQICACYYCSKVYILKR